MADDSILDDLKLRVAALEAANATLRESEEKYRTIFDTMDEGYCSIQILLDDKGAPFDVLLLEVNEAYKKQTGIPDAAGKLASEIAPNNEPGWLESWFR